MTTGRGEEMHEFHGIYDPRIDVLSEYGGSAASSRLRMYVYNFSEDLRNIRDEIIGKIKVPDNGTFLDVGCSDGENLLAIYDKNGGVGEYIGIDLDEHLIMTANARARRNGLRNVNFIPTSANMIGLKDEAADVITSMFMQYHLPDPEKGLEEYRRILKPGGLLVLATSGPGNKTRHREFEQGIALRLGKRPPPTFAEPYDSDIARASLPGHFETVVEHRHRSRMIITPDRVTDYLLSLNTMVPHYSPELTEEEKHSYKSILEEFVYPTIYKEIMQRGYFSDDIDRSYFTCYKYKTNAFPS